MFIGSGEENWAGYFYLGPEVDNSLENYYDLDLQPGIEKFIY